VSARSPPDRSEIAWNFFAPGLGNDFDAGFEDVGFVQKHEFGLAAFEEEGEHFLEFFLDGVEGLGEQLLGLSVEFCDGGLEVADGLVDVVLLNGEEIVTLLEFVVFLERVHVDGAHLVDFFAQIVEPLLGFFRVDFELGPEFLNNGLELGVIGAPDFCLSGVRSSCGVPCV